MAASGLRLGEVLDLDRADVDLEHGVLHARARKPAKHRDVPLHASTTRALCNYARARKHHCPEPTTPAFFLAATGARLTRSHFYRTFPKLIRKAGLEDRGYRVRPRPHDMRHTFAVCTLLEWHQAGEEVDRRMPELSTYLGHVDPASTYWYLEAVPELMALVSSRLEQLPEVLS